MSNIPLLFYISMIVLVSRVQNAVTSTVTATGSIDYATWKNVFAVTGVSSYTSQPTIGVLSFTIQSTNLQASVALQQANSVLNKTVMNLQASNNTYSIQSTGLSIQPADEWNYQEQQSKFIGYQVTNNLQIQTTNLKALGKFIDIAVKSGLNTVNSITFQKDPQKAKQDELMMMDEAVSNAYQQAQQAVKLLNQKIVGISYINLQTPQVTESPVTRPMYAMSMAADKMSSASTEVYAGTQTSTYSATVGFFIDQL